MGRHCGHYLNCSDSRRGRVIIWLAGRNLQREERIKHAVRHLQFQYNLARCQVKPRLNWGLDCVLQGPRTNSWGAEAAHEESKTAMN